MLYDKKVEPPYNPNVVRKLCAGGHILVARMFIVVGKVLFGHSVVVVFTNRRVSLT